MLLSQFTIGNLKEIKGPPPEPTFFSVRWPALRLELLNQRLSPAAQPDHLGELWARGPASLGGGPGCWCSEELSRCPDMFPVLRSPAVHALRGTNPASVMITHSSGPESWPSHYHGISLPAWLPFLPISICGQMHPGLHEPDWSSRSRPPSARPCCMELPFGPD